MSDDRIRRVRGIDDSDEESDGPAAGSPIGSGSPDHADRDGDRENDGDGESEPDSSEDDEDDDDDEEEIAKVREGFIVDDDENDNEDDSEGGRRRKRRRRSRKPSEDFAQELDEDDLDLVKEASGIPDSAASRFKRLKRTGDAASSAGRDLTSMFDDEDGDNDDEDDDADGAATRYPGEFDDFIEEDDISDEEERRRQEALETQTRSQSQRNRRGLADLTNQLTGLDEEKLGEIYEIFGDGEMYDWALEGEDEMEQRGGELGDEDGTVDLKDVFEPSELAARMLTAEDNNIRTLDIPERYQLLRQKLRHGYEISDAWFQEKKDWIADRMLEEKRLLLVVEPDLKEPLRAAVVNVVRFISLENYEVPYIWHHRQDYLQEITMAQAVAPEDENPEEAANVSAGGAIKETVHKQLLSRDDLWKIVMLDMDFHFLFEKRKSTEELWASLEVDDISERAVFDDMFTRASSIVEYQDIMDFLQFQYSGVLKGRSDGSVKLHSRFGVFDRIRQSNIYDLVLATRISAEDFATNLELGQRVKYVSDPALSPLALAQDVVGDSDASSALESCREMLAMEMSYHPKIRRYFRQHFEKGAKVDVIVTEDGKKKIDDNSPFADIKYAMNLSFEELKIRPELYLTMLAAEQQGLVVVRLQYPNYKTTLFEDSLTQFLFSDNQSDIGVEWNQFRRRIFKETSRTIVPLITRNIRENLRTACVRVLAADVRRKFTEKLDQAPYKPPGFVAGTIPRVLAISPGNGNFNTDAVLGVVIDEDGHLIEHIKFSDPRDNDFKKQLREIVERKSPDVIGMAGYTPEARKLFEILQDTVRDEQIMSGDQTETLIEVRWVQDEVARIYRNTTRAQNEYTDLVPVARYCVGLARYVQSPILEYAALGPEINAIQIHPNQDLLPAEDFTDAIESAFVDSTNLQGVDINLAVRNPYLAGIVPFISGLGRRKSSGLLQAIQSRGGTISNRTELVTKELMAKTIWVNCASFMKIPQESAAAKDVDSDPLDATRIHPEDYNLARKMAADALELDEEDIEAYEANGTGGVVAQLFMDDVDKLDELVLEDFAATLESEFHQKKLVTLETIRQELKDNYKELRSPLHVLNDLDVFTMLTGETKNTLKTDSIVSAVVRRANNRELVLRLNSGVDAIAESGNISDDRVQPVSALFNVGQAVRAVVLSVDYRAIFASVNTRQHVIRDTLQRAKRSHGSLDASKWNTAAEQADLNAFKQKVDDEQKRGRIIKHPLFKLQSAKQAEEYLAPMQRGDLVIRPSSRGNDHIVITWKVADMLYQHVDVLEIDKPNDYSLGRLLQVGKWRYSDLDELIIMHIQAMARKVDEMLQSDKFQSGSKADVEKWLTAYTNARPNQSVYAYCFDHKRPGYFLLCFKTGATAPIKEWHVKVIPNGYELMGNSYPDVPSLNNGFKMIFSSQARR